MPGVKPSTAKSHCPLGRSATAVAGSLAPASARALGAVLALAVALLAAEVTVFAVPAADAATERVSIASSGTEANSFSTASSISSDGRIVAYASVASNLVAGDTNAVSDVFVRDRSTGSTILASVAPGGLPANGTSMTPSVSADGRLVAFASRARNLVPGKSSNFFDVFVRDLVTGTTVRASTSMTGGDGTGDSFQPALSGDGRFVAFASLSSNLVPGDTNATFDVFVRDLTTGAIERVSVSSSGAESNGSSVTPRLSGDGSRVVFHSFASNLVAGDTNAVADVFVRDRASGVTVRASVASDGSQGNQQSLAGTLSADGRFAAFVSDANNLVAGDGNGRTDVFVRDLQTGVTERASVASDGSEGNGQSGFTDPPSLSADGRFVAFTSASTNLAASDVNFVNDVFVRDRRHGSTRRASVSSAGDEGDGGATLWATLTADGRAVAFASSASNLVAGDGNAAQDVFVNTNDCGNGVLNVHESCDDSNLDDGDCCDAECGFETAGSACSDDDLCTQSDACDGSGSCVGANPIVCPESDDACRTAGACDPATGTCPVVDAPAGTACDDGDLCTRTDACDGAGACVGSNPVVCPDGDDACRAGGACDPATGTCPTVDAPAGTPCDDGDLCTQTDVCDGAGACVGSNPVVCPESDEACRSAGACDPATGTCSSANAPAGTACDDGDRCTRTDACDGAGACVGSNPVVCPVSQDACRTAGACEPATGSCSMVDAPDGTACDDGEACTVGDLCLSGVCQPGDVEPSACLDPSRCYHSELSWLDALRWRARQVALSDEFASASYWLMRPTEVCATANTSLLTTDDDALPELMACHDVDPARTSSSTAPDPKRRAVVKNALGVQQLSVGSARELCLRVNEHGGQPSTLLDDYTCYAAHVPYGDPDPARRSVELRDRFGKARVSVGRPTMLCNPTSVDGGPVEQPLAHLVCYATYDEWRSGAPTPLRPVSLTLDERFGTIKPFLFFSHRLCLPTALREVAVEANASDKHGKSGKDK